MLRLLFAVSLLIAAPSCASHEPAPVDEAAAALSELTIDYLAWSDDLFSSEEFASIGLLGHIRDWDGPPTLKEFTARADKVFYLESSEHRIVASTGTGGVTSGSHGRFVMLRMGRGLLPDREYVLRPRNEGSDYRWKVADGVVVTR